MKDRGKSVHVYTDGHKMRKRALFPHHKHGEVSGVKISENAERPFVFADIRTTGASCPPAPNNSVLFTPPPWVI